jgi:nucleoside-diphosphate-sugar epimerase
VPPARALGADVSRFVRADVRDRALDALFKGGRIDAVVHFAASRLSAACEPLKLLRQPSEA